MEQKIKRKKTSEAGRERENNEMIYGALYYNELYANMVCSNKLSTLNQNTAEKNIQPDSFSTHIQQYVSVSVLLYFCPCEDQV